MLCLIKLNTVAAQKIDKCRATFSRNSITHDPTARNFSHQGSHFKCHKTHTSSLRHLWREENLRGKAPIEKPLLLGKHKGGIFAFSSWDTNLSS